MSRILTIPAFLILCAFLGIILYYVPRLDLTVVIVVSLLLTGYDLFFHKPPLEPRP